MAMHLLLTFIRNPLRNTTLNDVMTYFASCRMMTFPSGYIDVITKYLLDVMQNDLFVGGPAFAFSFRFDVDFVAQVVHTDDSLAVDRFLRAEHFLKRKKTFYL